MSPVPVAIALFLPDHEAAFLPFVEQALPSMVATAGELWETRPVFHTDRESLARSCEQLGAGVRLVKDARPGFLDSLVPGGDEVTALLAASGRTRALLVDFRLLGSADRAMRLAGIDQRPDELAASVRTPRDHPCQIIHPVDTLAVGALQWLDPRGAPAGCRWTRPWSPAPPQSLAVSAPTAGDHGLGLLVEAGRARTVAPEGMAEDGLLALDPTEDWTGLGAALFRHGPGQYRLMLHGLDQAGEDAVCLLHPEAGEPVLVPLAHADGGLKGFLPARLVEESSVVPYAVVEPARGDGHDFSLNMESGEGLWFRHPATRVLTNGLTGKAITGRQQFPELHELSGEFLLGRVDLLADLETSLRTRRCTGLFLKGERSSVIDFLPTGTDREPRP